MKDRVSPTFIAAGVVIGLSCFILLSMLFYGTGDYYEGADNAAASDGLRFSVASAFFRSLGVGAYLGWSIILALGVIVFFREKIGDLALRGASLVVVVVSGAALASLFGANQQGGDLGIAVGGILSAGLGTTLGAIVMLGIFGASFLYATDYGFFRYVRQAREAVAVLETDEPEEIVEEEDKPGDWSKLIDRAVTEVAEEKEPITAEAEVPDGVPADLLPVADEDEPGGTDPLVLNFRSPIETEDLDEDLLVSGESEEPVAVTPTPGVEIEEEPEIPLAVEDESEAGEFLLDPTDGILLEEDILLDAEVAETAREMLEALEGSTPIAFPEPEPVATTEEAEEPVAEEEEEEPVEAVVEPEPAEEEEEEYEPAIPAAPGDVDSVFDALLGPAPSMAKPGNGAITPVAPAPVVEPSVAEAPVVPAPVVAEPVFEETDVEEPGFILTDDVIFMDAVEVAEEPVREVVPEVKEEVEETPATVETGTEEREILEREIVTEIEEEIAGEVFVEQVILVDDRLDVPSVAEAAEDEEAPLLPFMEESGTTSEPEADTDAVPEPEIPVLEDVAETQRKPGVLRSLFGKKNPSVTRPGDPLLDEAARLVIEKGRASVVFLQRRLDIGYTRASRLIDAMERHGLVGPLEESGSRDVLMSGEEWETMRG